MSQIKSLTVRLPDEIYERIRLEAGFAHRSLGAQALYMLEQYAFGEHSESPGEIHKRVLDETEEKGQLVPALPKRNPSKLGSTAKHYVKDEFSQE